MPILIIESAIWMLVVFGLSARLGWWLSKGGAVRPMISVASAFDVTQVTTEPVKESPAALAVAANHFTSGVVMPFPAMTPKTTGDAAVDRASLVAPTPKLDMAASHITVQRDDSSLQKRMSSLAVMTPESVEAAVQQAGSGLEPEGLSTPQGPVDDLTVISGITEAHERQLNALGVYHFWQIAGWTPGKRRLVVGPGRAVAAHRSRKLDGAGCQVGKVKIKEFSLINSNYCRYNLM